jgi:EF-P beta-lysylation protein EpmB
MEILTTSGDPVGAGSCPSPMTWQQHMKAAVRELPDLLQRLNLPENEAFGARAVSTFPVFVPLPYLSRIRAGDPCDPLLRQVLPVQAEDTSPEGYSLDPLGEDAATLQPGLLQKYHGRVLMVTTGACAIHCRYCFRRHFPYGESPAMQQLSDQLARQLAADQNLDEVILSGGDPLTLVDQTLSDLLDVIESAGHVKRLRIHTRLPIVIPQRVTQTLADRLTQSRLQIVIVVHANHANEIDGDVEQALDRLKRTGAMLLNQSVLLQDVNDSPDALIHLSNRLLAAGVLPYYLHQLDPVIGASHFAVDVERGKELIAAMRAQLPGYAVPRYVQEIAGEPNKTVLA